MKKEYIDLHIHSNASDGLFTPAEVVDYAMRAGLAAIAMTDHDTVDGFKVAHALIEEERLEVLPGVELSCYYKGMDVHVLGYLIDYENPEFVRKIEAFRKERYERGEAMVAKLNDLGINLSMETVKLIAGNSAVGRPHLADALVREEFVQTYDEAFARYLGYHAPAYVPKPVLTPEQGIDLIHLVRGVAVMAHPGTLKHDEFIPDFAEMGLDGIEAYHSLHDKAAVQRYKNFARKHGMIFTGGSDCHGPRKGKVLMGSQKVPYSCLIDLRRVKEEK
ncbi:MAG TPA: phosphatase [candidate division Zixibacteria bacterium]|nr:phosphatase [candidate division Zixibacteria bacterium]HBZ00755.1 phosphatase [candidate division Zixibacteria bacterium]